MTYDIDRPLLADAAITPMSYNTMPRCSGLFVHGYTLSQPSGCGGLSLCIGREGGRGEGGGGREREGVNHGVGAYGME